MCGRITQEIPASPSVHRPIFKDRVLVISLGVDGRMHVNVRIVAKDEAQATPEPDNVPWSPEEIAWVRGYDEFWYLLPPTNTLCSESCATVRDTPGQ